MKLRLIIVWYHSLQQRRPRASGGTAQRTAHGFLRGSTTPRRTASGVGKGFGLGCCRLGRSPPTSGGWPQRRRRRWSSSSSSVIQGLYTCYHGTYVVCCALFSLLCLVFPTRWLMASLMKYQAASSTTLTSEARQRLQEGNRSGGRAISIPAPATVRVSSVASSEPSSFLRPRDGGSSATRLAPGAAAKTHVRNSSDGSRRPAASSASQTACIGANPFGDDDDHGNGAGDGDSDATGYDEAKNPFTEDEPVVKDQPINPFGEEDDADYNDSLNPFAEWVPRPFNDPFHICCPFRTWLKSSISATSTFLFLLSVRK